MKWPHKFLNTTSITDRLFIIITFFQTNPTAWQNKNYEISASVYRNFPGRILT